MNTTTHLARHILQFQPNKDAARLCLYHYLIHHCDTDAPLTPELFENFARRALCFQHWRDNRIALSQEIQYILQHYNETYILEWSFKEISFPDHWQVINIESRIEAVVIIENWIQRTFSPSHRKRIFFTSKENYLAVIQDPEGDITVIEMTPQILIRNGLLEPLNTDHRLYYTASLELKPNIAQKIMVAENTSARFYTGNNKVEGRVIRGYIFQQQQVLQGLLNQFPAIFYPLKSLEQYFVDRKSDPTYQELVHTLEKGVELLRMNHPEAENFAKVALQRGRSALESLFTNDSMIKILVEDLEKTSASTSESLYL